MSVPKWQQFWTSLLGEYEFYVTETFSDTTPITDLERGAHALRVYRNTDGTWSLMPNWLNSAEKNHRQSMSTTYNTFEAIPVDIQEKLGVLMLKEPGGEWLTGIGKRVDDGVFWLEDG